MMEESVLSILSDIRNWMKSASYANIRALLKEALPDAQSRLAYQMFDGVAGSEQVRAAAKMSPNRLVALTQRWTSMGLMEILPDKRRKRIFDLKDFGLLDIEG